jgi:hypothetical protein
MPADPELTSAEGENLDELLEERSGGAIAGVAEFFGEFWYFLKTSKKWWLLPIVVLFLAMSVFILLTESATVVPFIYTLF